MIILPSPSARPLDDLRKEGKKIFSGLQKDLSGLGRAITDRIWPLTAEPIERPRKGTTKPPVAQPGGGAGVPPKRTTPSAQPAPRVLPSPVTSSSVVRRDFRSGVPTTVPPRDGAVIVKAPTPFGEQSVSFSLNVPGNSTTSEYGPSSTFANAGLLGTPDQISEYVRQKEQELKNNYGSMAGTVDQPATMLRGGQLGTKDNVTPLSAVPPDFAQSSTIQTTNQAQQYSGKLKDVWNQNTQQAAWLQRASGGGDPINTGNTTVDKLANDAGWATVKRLGGLGSERGMDFARKDLLLRANRIQDPEARKAFLDQGYAALASGADTPNNRIQSNYEKAKGMAQASAYGPAFPEVSPNAKSSVPNTPPVAAGTANSAVYGNNSKDGGFSTSQTPTTLQPGAQNAPTTRAAPQAAPVSTTPPAASATFANNPYLGDQIPKNGFGTFNKGPVSDYYYGRQTSPALQNLGAIQEELRGIRKRISDPGLSFAEKTINDIMNQGK